MSLTADDVKKIAHLARLNLNNEELILYTNQLTNILSLMEQMGSIDTSQVSALAHPLAASTPLRPDNITEVNQRELFQALAPQVEAGLYLVPQVIE